MNTKEKRDALVEQINNIPKYDWFERGISEHESQAECPRDLFMMGYEQFRKDALSALKERFK